MSLFILSGKQKMRYPDTVRSHSLEMGQSRRIVQPHDVALFIEIVHISINYRSGCGFFNLGKTGINTIVLAVSTGSSVQSQLQFQGLKFAKRWID